MELIPRPQHVTWGTGSFSLTAPLTVTGGSKASDYLRARLQKAAGLVMTTPPENARQIRFCPVAGLEAERYQLVVATDQVTITYTDEAAAMWAVQTLLQLLPAEVHGPGPVEPASLELPCVQIDDQPKYSWRGSMLDVARHFLPVSDVLRHLDVMAMHKLNVLHLHLTDDQGWRVPIKKYPLLTEIGGQRPGTLAGHQPKPGEYTGLAEPPHDGLPCGGAYTAEDIAAIVAHAKELGIVVVPEIDMPGHMEAAIAAYPWLGCCDHVKYPRTWWGVSEHVLRLSPKTLEFCKDVLDEVMQLFPESPIHIGGDECPGREWLSDPVSREAMSSAGAETSAQAQAWFEQRVCEHLLSAGRQVIAWDEVLEMGAPQGVTVMVWRDEKAVTEALQQGHDVIAAPYRYTYFDYCQSADPRHPLSIGGPLPMEQIAGLTDLLEAQPPSNARLLGGQFQIWTEYIRGLSRVEYFAWPRGCSVAQQLWSGDAEGVRETAQLGKHLDRLTAAGVNWCRL